MTARLARLASLLLIPALAAACSGATPTPLIVYVTASPGPSAPPTPAPTATTMPSAAPTRATTAAPAGVRLSGTMTFDGEFADTITFNPDGTCAGKAAWSAIKEGANLVISDEATGSLLGQGKLGDSTAIPSFSQCQFDWTVTVSRTAAKYQVVLASAAYWSTATPDDLTLKASVIATLPTPGPDDFAEDIAYYQEYLADEVRDSIGIHIKGVEETDVTLERMFVWVESDYSTQGVLKDIMYDLYDDLASGISSDWEPDIVIRMGSSYNDAWLEGTTDAGARWDIEDQLQWERATAFKRHGSL